MTTTEQTTPSPKKYELKHWLMLATISVVWGCADFFAKKGLKVFAPNEVGLMRICIASILLSPIALFRIKKVNIQNLPKILLIGLFGSVLPAFLFARSQAKLASSINTALNALTPICTLLVSSVFFRRKIPKNEVYAVLVGCLGILTIVSSGVGSSSSDTKYVLFPLLGCMCYALSINIIKRHLKNTSIVLNTAVSLLPYSLAMGFVIFTKTDIVLKLKTVEGAYTALAFVVALAACSSTLAFLLFNMLSHSATPVFASVATLLAPVISIVWGLLDGENLSINHYLGIVTILAGVGLLNKKSPKGHTF